MVWRSTWLPAVRDRLPNRRSIRFASAQPLPFPGSAATQEPDLAHFLEYLARLLHYLPVSYAMTKRSLLPASERPEAKALNGQLRRMSERDLLALVLGNGVSGGNVKQVATALLRKFGIDSQDVDHAHHYGKKNEYGDEREQWADQVWHDSVILS
jgi:hypothetical protein